MFGLTHRRNKLIVNPGFQYFILGYFTICSFLTMCIFYVINYFYFQHLFVHLSKTVPVVSEHLKLYLVHQNEYMLLSFVFTTAIVILISFIGGMYISNRVAGPIYRMQSTLKNIIESKKLEPMKFREGDFFVELESSFNEMAQIIDPSLSSIDKTEKSGKKERSADVVTQT